MVRLPDLLLTLAPNKQMLVGHMCLAYSKLEHRRLWYCVELLRLIAVLLETVAWRIWPQQHLLLCPDRNVAQP